MPASIAMRKVIGLILIACYMPIHAFGWGTQAHRAIATEAYAELSPKARADVATLLALEPGATLASISTWADEHRSPATARWHFVNIAADAACRYVAERDCPGGACVVGAIERQTAVFRSTAPATERLKALKYLVHLVADVHQPLHAGRAEDKGGNLYQVHAFGRGTNLHALWDSGLVASDTGLFADWPKGDAGGSPAAWAEQSCRITEAPGFYPTGHKIGEAYAAEQAATVKQQMADAAARLRTVLEQQCP